MVSTTNVDSHMFTYTYCNIIYILIHVCVQLERATVQIVQCITNRIIHKEMSFDKQAVHDCALSWDGAHTILT